MTRALGWTVVVLGGLLVLFTLALLLSGPDGDLRVAVDRGVEAVVRTQVPGPGGRRLRERVGPIAVTVDERLDTPEGATFSWSTGLLTQRINARGLNPQGALAYLLEQDHAAVVCPEGWGALASTHVDIWCERYAGLFGRESGRDGFALLRRAAAHELCLAYGLRAEEGEVEAEVSVLKPGPAFDERAPRSRHEGFRQSQGDGYYEVSNAPLGSVAQWLTVHVPVRIVDFANPGERRDLALTWDAADPAGLRRALAEQLDLHLTQEVRRVAQVTVTRVGAERAGLSP